MEEILRKGKRLWPAPSPIIIPGFTATELAAAEQLVHLSESSADSSPATLQRSISSALSSCSSPISVESIAPTRYRHPLPFAVAEDAEEDDDDGGFKRLRPRYRPIDEVYADCVRIGGDRRRWPEMAVAGTRRKREVWE